MYRFNFKEQRLFLLALLLVSGISVISLANQPTPTPTPPPTGCDSGTVCVGLGGDPCENYSFPQDTQNCGPGSTIPEVTVEACSTGILELNCAPGDPSSVIQVTGIPFDLVDPLLEFNPSQITEAGTHQVSVTVHTACCIENDFHGCYGEEDSVTLVVPVTATGTAVPIRAGSTVVVGDSEKSYVAEATWQVDDSNYPPTPATCSVYQGSIEPNDDDFDFKYDASDDDRCCDSYRFKTDVTAEYSIGLSLEDKFFGINWEDAAAAGRVYVCLPSGVLINEKIGITSDLASGYGVGLGLGPVSINLGDLFQSEEKVEEDSIEKPELSDWFPTQNCPVNDATWHLDVSSDANANVSNTQCPYPSEFLDPLEWEPHALIFLDVSVANYETRWANAN